MKISVVAMNYNSPYQLSRCILPHMERMECVDEIVIVHGSPDTEFEYSSDHCHVVNLRRPSNRLDQTGEGMLARFRGFQKARNGTVLSLDDDMMIPEQSLNRLCAEYDKDPEIIHSIAGKNPDKGLRDHPFRSSGQVTYTFSSCTMYPRRLADDIFDWLGKNRDAWMIRHRLPERNGEDLFASLLSIHRTGRLNRVHPIRYMLILTAGGGSAGRISDSPTHLQERTAFLRHMIPKMGIRDTVRVEPTRLSFDDNWYGRLLSRACMMYYRLARRQRARALMQDWCLR